MMPPTAAARAYEKEEFPEILFWEKVAHNPEYKCLYFDSWRTDIEKKEFVKLLDDNFQVNRKLIKDNGYIYYWLSFQDVEALFSHYQGTLSLTAANDPDRVLEAKLKEIFTPEIYAEDDSIKLKFWYKTSTAPNSVTRKIIIPSWKDIKGNYAPEVVKELDRLTAIDPKDISGKLVLWHGPPGTGKTFAIRALASEWRKWASFEYITDPEHFLGDPSYTVAVALNTSRSWEYSDDPEEDLPEGEFKVEDKWKVLVLEDAGELIQLDAKQQTGQSLSRLLNLVDGLIGQGLKLIILITTNEQIDHLHAAASRAGRVLSVENFPALSITQANKWLADNEIDTKITYSTTIADLYARKSDINYEIKKAPTKSFGLSPR